MGKLKPIGVMLGAVGALLLATPALAAGGGGNGHGHGKAHLVKSAPAHANGQAPAPTPLPVTVPAVAGTPAPVTRQPASGSGPTLALPLGAGVAGAAGVTGSAPVPAPTAAPAQLPVLAEPIGRIVRVFIPGRLPAYVLPVLLGILGAMLLVAVVLLVRWRRYASRQAALDRAKSDFLMQASHQLRTPLSVVAGYLSLASEGDLGELPSDFRQVLPVMADKMGQIEKLISEMLLATEISQGTLRLRSEAIDLRTVVAECVLASRVRTSRAHRIVQATAPEPIALEADPDYVAQAVGSLLDNALELSPEGGTVTVDLRVVDGFAEVVVRGEGVGISEADRERIFSRFGRIDAAESGSSAGSGLGLYISRELARLEGGDITVRTEAGSGSEFRLRLPLAGTPR